VFPVVNLGVCYVLPAQYPTYGQSARFEVLGTEGVILLDMDNKDSVLFTDQGVPHAKNWFLTLFGLLLIPLGVGIYHLMFSYRRWQNSDIAEEPSGDDDDIPRAMPVATPVRRRKKGRGKSQG